MTLQEAYQGWQEQQQNKPLFAKTREAFRKAWFALPTNKPCQYYTKEILGEALAATDQAEENKAKAASVMIHVLTFASSAEPGDNPRPSFTFGDLMAYTRKPVPAARHKRRVKPQKNTEDTEERAAASPPELGGARGGLNERKDESTVQTTPTPPNSGGEAAAPVKPKRMIRKVDDDICQLDPKTLEVVKKWPHAHRIMQELGIGNVVRAIERCGIAGGFYWTYARDLDTFSERLAARQQHNAKAHADHCAQMRAAKEPQKAASKREESEARIDSHEREQARPQGKDTEKKKKTSKKTAAASPPELGGARGGLNERKDESPVQTTPAPPNSGGEAAAQVNERSEEPRRSAASKALEVFTDDELFEELDRRGWFCVLSRTEIVTIGLED